MIEKNMYWRKFWTFGILSALTYLLLFSTLFVEFFVLKSMIFVMLFFLFFHFFYLEIRIVPIKYLIVGAVVISAIEWFFVGYSHFLLVISLVVINAWIVFLAYSLQDESRNKIRFSSWGYFNVGGYIFTVFITIGYSLFVLGYYDKFPFTCENLSSASNSVIDFVAKPFKVGMEEAKILKANTEWFFNSKIQDLVTVGKSITIKNDSKTPTLLTTINDYKKTLIDQAIQDNTSINRWICDYVLWELNKIYATSGFQTSVIILMFLILYGFVRIVFWVMTGIAFLCFKLLFVSKVYHIHTEMKEVEDLE